MGESAVADIWILAANGSRATICAAPSPTAQLLEVAAFSILGLLRANLGAPLQSLVSLEVDKDLTALRADELRARLPERL
jgi:protein required for attachment to host cells